MLIYERIREEAHMGRSVISALEAGFNRAFATIIDSNVTMFVAAVILYLFGSGAGARLRGVARPRHSDLGHHGGDDDAHDDRAMVPQPQAERAADMREMMNIARAKRRTRVAELQRRSPRPSPASGRGGSEPSEPPMKLLRLAPENTKFGFMRFRRVSYPLSALLSIVAVMLFFTVGMNFGIDFAGGTQVELRAKSGVADLAELRAKADSLGPRPGRGAALGRRTRRDVLRVNVQPGGEAGQRPRSPSCAQAFGDAYEFRSVEAVGPRVSGELVQSGTLGVVVAILAVLTYLWFRFEWQFAVGAIIGTMHDLLLTVGFFCVTQLEFNQTSIAAILTIVGYSLNETVVVLDRIREVMRKYKKLSTAEIVDMSVNAVLPRTIMTATTVFLALLALFFLGGHVIRSFSAAMIWGIFVATYSSIFICSPMLIYLGVRADTLDKGADGPTSSRPRQGHSLRPRVTRGRAGEASTV